jgi:hypothetical protein
VRQLRELSGDADNLRGRLVLRFGWVQVLDDPCHVASQRYTALKSRGWPGELLRCGPTCTAGLIEL